MPIAETASRGMYAFVFVYLLYANVMLMHSAAIVSTPQITKYPRRSSPIADSAPLFLYAVPKCIYQTVYIAAIILGTVEMYFFNSITDKILPYFQNKNNSANVFLHLRCFVKYQTV